MVVNVPAIVKNSARHVCRKRLNNITTAVSNIPMKTNHVIIKQLKPVNNKAL